MRNLARLFCRPTPTCSGSHIKILYKPLMSENGTFKLVEYDSVDTDEEIRIAASLCDMNIIIQRLNAGDRSVLTDKSPMYGDFAQPNMPHTMAEALQLVMDGERAFELLPSDIRLKFDNDFKKWFATSGGEDWLEKMGISINSSVVTPSDPSSPPVPDPGSGS